MHACREIPVYIPGNSRVHKTAADEFAIALGMKSFREMNLINESVPSQGSVFIGMPGESDYVRELIFSGILHIHNTNMELDAFEVVCHKNILYLLGNTERGMLHAVYEMQEYLLHNTEIKNGLHLSGTFHIPMRIFHQRFSPWPGERSDFRYISHMGATHCLVCHDWDAARNFQKYVVSEIFPDAVDACTVSRNYQDLKGIVKNCMDYGLEPCLWMTELPCQGGPWLPEENRQDFFKRYPSDVLSDSGTYEGKVLCFSQPIVQAYYRELLKKFFESFPEISILFLFGMDSGGEFCNPESCPGCKGMSRFEQRDRLIRFLVEEGRKVRPGIRVLTTSWYWGQQDMDEFLSRQGKLPMESGLYMAAQKDGWQVERQCHTLLQQARRICRNHGQLFIGYDNFQWGDDTVHHMNDIQDYPLGIGAKIRRWFELGADGVFDHWGGINEQISCNSIACREFFLNPLADPVKISGKIALKQFGSKAGRYVLKSWIYLEKAHRILSNFCVWQPHQWPMWYYGVIYYPDIEGIKKFLAFEGMEALPSCEACGITYNEGSSGELYESVGKAWLRAYPCFEKAASYMDMALAACENGDPFYAYWWNGSTTPFSRKEHIKRAQIYIKANSLVGREIGIHFQLVAMYLRLSEKGKETNCKEYCKYAAKMLKQDFDACMAVAEYLTYTAEFNEDKSYAYGELFLQKAKFVKNLLQ